MIIRRASTFDSAMEMLPQRYSDEDHYTIEREEDRIVVYGHVAGWRDARWKIMEVVIQDG